MDRELINLMSVT